MKILERIKNACLKEGIPVKDVRDTLMLIRHLEIGFGCPNQCASCFSSAPKKIIQMKHSSFNKIMSNIGYELRRYNEELPFFYLGAAVDPRAIKQFYKYYNTQCNYLPSQQMIKTFSHGWDLCNKREIREARKFLNIFIFQNIRHPKQRLTLSFDQFSLWARRDWDSYLHNFTANLLFFEKLIKLGQLRIEITYVPDYMQCNPKFRFETIMNGIKHNKYNSYEDIKNDLYIESVREIDVEVLRSTKGLLQVLENVKIPFEKILTIVRDNRAIFPAGRGISFFKNKTNDEKEACFINQEQKVLYSMEHLPLKNISLIIKPDGCINVVDYRGYKLISQLNSGLPVIPNIKFFEVN